MTTFGSAGAAFGGTLGVGGAGAGPITGGIGTVGGKLLVGGTKGDGLGPVLGPVPVDA